MNEATDTVVEEEVAVEAEQEIVSADADDAGEQQAEAEELEITIGDDRPEQTEAAPSWVKELRKKNRELAQRNRELEEKAKAPAAQEREPEIGPEPEMGDADVDYDDDKFKAKWAMWNKAKIQAEAKQAEAAETQRKAGEAWQKTLDTYRSEAKALKVPDYDDAEGALKEAFSTVQQAIIVQAVEKRAQLVYALGKNPKRLAELAAIDDPVKFAVKIGEMAALMKVTSKKPTTKPESSPRSGHSGVAVGNAKLEDMRKQAEKTGDFTAYFNAKRASQKK